MSARMIAATLCALSVAGCGGSARATPPDTETAVRAAPRSDACVADAQDELVAVARRIYAQAASGRNTRAAVKRLGRSPALGAAVAANDPRAVRIALKPLIKHQITRIVLAGARGRVLARFGTTRAYGPVRGVVRSDGRVVGTYVLAVSRQRDFAGLVRELTGASARFARGGGDAGVSFPATLYPAGAARVVLALPPIPTSVCAPTAAETRAATVGFVARKLLNAEAHGAGARRAVRMAERDPAFRRAVAARDQHLVWDAIVGWFRDKQFHIVRGRVWDGHGFVDDVGGPYVVSPATGTLRRHGRVLGRFMLAIQDDTGYIKLLHRFTGADVTLWMNGRTVPGSNVVPGAPFAPGLRAVSYHGRRWLAVGVVGTAFPKGPLGVSLLVH